jgi:hypothetical protein
LIAAIGCDSGAPPVSTSTEEGTVTGTVTIRGKKVSKGQVVFDPSNYQRQAPARTVEIQKDGTYSVTTLVGQNSVQVVSPVLNRDRELSDFSLFFEVQPGANTYNIVLPPPE